MHWDYRNPYTSFFSLELCSQHDLRYLARQIILGLKRGIGVTNLTSIFSDESSENTLVFPECFHLWLYDKPNSVRSYSDRNRNTGVDNHLSSPSITLGVKRFSTVRNTVARPCIEVRILPLHFHVAMKFIPRS